jgi:Rad3-related DNA helicase
MNNKSLFEASFNNYKDVIKGGKKAILFSYCRGKLNEGINFSDDLARSIILVGIPYPPW